MKSRSKKALYNGVAGITAEICLIICGLILPRIILSTFGSKYNGITQSITQFLSFMTLFRAGVSAVTKAALYKPLANHDNLTISRIIRATEIFMRKVALLFVAGLTILAIVYPLLVSKEFELLFAATLVLIIGFSTFAQYYFGITYQMLLEADQCQYIVSILSATTTVVNVIIAAILIKLGFGIHGVKMGSAIVFALNPVAVNIIVRKKYKIRKNVEPDNSAIKQRWDAFAQQVAMLIRDNTDIVILTIVANTLEVSVYTVYFMVIKAITGMIRAFTNGIGAAFGNMMAKNETDALQKNLKLYEFLIYSLCTTLYSSTCVLVTPFVLVYTSGVHDVDYNRPLFGYIMAFAYVFFCIRIPYQNIVEVAGHFKQTKKSSYIEAGINLGTSVILSINFGIVGVAIGTLLAMVFRTFHYAYYVSKNLIHRNFSQFIFRLISYLATMGIVITFFFFVKLPTADSYLTWLINAIIVFVVSFIATFTVDMIFFREQVFLFKEKLLGLRKK